MLDKFKTNLLAILGFLFSVILANIVSDQPLDNIFTKDITIEMGIAATNLNLQESDGGLDMKVDYALDMNQEHVADCYLAIKAQPKDCKNFTI